MLSKAPATADDTARYTTIPISGSNVISRSFQNLSTFLSHHRPWSEFVALGNCDAPESLSSAAARLQMNAKYFGINYAILVSSCATVALIAGDLFAAIVYALVFAAWLVLFFFREDPMVVYGLHVDDRIVIVGLVLVSVIAVWLIGMGNSLLIGVSLGLIISAVHGVFRNLEGIFLDENDAVSAGLIGSSPASGSHRKDLHP